MRRSLAVVATAGLVLALFGPAAWGATTSFDLYLRGDSEPQGSMSTAAPSGGSLPNFDSGRNSDPGLTLSKTDGGSSETDPTKYQRWDYDASGLHLVVTGFTIWATMKDFDTDKTGRIAVYLMDCGSSCVVLDSSTHNVPGTGSWVKVSSPVGVDRSFAAGHSLSVQIVVLGNADDDMWFAYAIAGYPAALTTQQVIATTTTTSTTTTTAPTTTTLPSSSSTSSTIPSTTTTTVAGPHLPLPLPSTTLPGGSTTTTVPGEQSSSTTTAPSGSPSGQEGQETTTTIVFAEQPGSDDEPALVVALDGIDPPSEPPAGVSVLASSSDEFLVAAEIPPTAESISPLEGMLVVFSTAAQAFSTHLLPFLGLTFLGVTLLLVGVSRREDDEVIPRRKSGDWWFSG